jgi:uncharacterized protein (DUF58 family)
LNGERQDEGRGERQGSRLGVRRAATRRLRAWAARRHGVDELPARINRRRVYILPTRFGMMLAAILMAMLIAGLNYNSNLGLAFAFLMASVSFVTMHHCNRNLLGLSVDAAVEIDAVAGREARLNFALRNDSAVDRCDVEIRCLGAVGIGSVAAQQSEAVTLLAAGGDRGVRRADSFELRTLYPFGWFYAWTYVHSAITVYTSPAPSGNRLLPAAGASGALFHSEAPGEEDFAGLRSYQPGVPLKHMAWKVLARGGEAAVRSYSSLAAQPEWLDWAALESLDDEARLSQLAAWIDHSDAARQPYGLRLPGVEIAPASGAAHRIECLRALARHGVPA